MGLTCVAEESNSLTPMAARVIAIDGPAGSGKSSVSRAVAQELNFAYLDTGAMYRAMAWAVLDAGVSPDDAESVLRVAQSVDLVSETDPVSPTIAVNGKDVSVEIRQGDVTQAVSAVSAVPSVRDILVAAQRDAVARHPEGIVVEGRDIGTVVLPDADIKFFLTASPEVRAARRAKQDAQENREVGSMSETQQALIERDRKDSTRAVSPLAQADDARVLDSSNLTFDEVVQEIVRNIRD